MRRLGEIAKGFLGRPRTDGLGAQILATATQTEDLSATRLNHNRKTIYGPLAKKFAEEIDAPIHSDVPVDEYSFTAATEPSNGKVHLRASSPAGLKFVDIFYDASRSFLETMQVKETTRDVVLTQHSDSAGRMTLIEDDVRNGDLGRPLKQVQTTRAPELHQEQVDDYRLIAHAVLTLPRAIESQLTR